MRLRFLRGMRYAAVLKAAFLALLSGPAALAALRAVRWLCSSRLNAGL